MLSLDLISVTLAQQWTLYCAVSFIRVEYGEKNLCHTWVRVVNAESAGELCWDCEGSVDPAVRVHDTTGNAIHDAVDLVTNEPDKIWNPYHLGSRNINTEPSY